MYKIYINDRPLVLAGPTDTLPEWQDKPHLDTRYLGKPKHLLPYVDLMEKSQRYEAVILRYAEPDQLWADFRSLFHLVEAAGGVVHSEQTPEQVLFIYRRGMWDLPKGKIDEGETPEQAALREVGEETGLTCRLDCFLTHTWHTYRLPRKRMLKKTWWYRMWSPTTELQLQHEEDIESARWMAIEAALRTLQPIWQNIREVLRADLQNGAPRQ